MFEEYAFATDGDVSREGICIAGVEDPTRHSAEAQAPPMDSAEPRGAPHVLSYVAVEEAIHRNHGNTSNLGAASRRTTKT